MLTHDHEKHKLKKKNQAAIPTYCTHMYIHKSTAHSLRSKDDRSDIASAMLARVCVSSHFKSLNLYTPTAHTYTTTIHIQTHHVHHTLKRKYSSSQPFFY